MNKKKYIKPSTIEVLVSVGHLLLTGSTGDKFRLQQKHNVLNNASNQITSSGMAPVTGPDTKTMGGIDGGWFGSKTNPWGSWEN